VVRCRKVACVTKIAVPLESGTVEVSISSLELKILRKITINGNNLAWKIAQSLSPNRYYQSAVYNAISDMIRKGIIEATYEGKRGGLTVSLTPFGEKVVEALKEKTVIGCLYLV
jgi:DNA-binding PadR family transcriptional regulator